MKTMKKSIEELSRQMVKSMLFDGFVSGKFKDDQDVNYCKPQKCWVNQCWVVTPDNENNPILMSFYSQEKDRITDDNIMKMCDDMTPDDYSKIYNGKGSPIFYVCWDDYLPPCGMFLNGLMSRFWRYYTVLTLKPQS